MELETAATCKDCLRPPASAPQMNCAPDPSEFGAQSHYEFEAANLDGKTSQEANAWGDALVC
ncbi:hypothetical protein GCM10007920_31950 [Ciceribacter naphthalenivorans]|uniref:Uncharacterized protein n=2 Tax=Alphaproteobacteria TaxID=28211 RepID=A0A512HMZ4_9HYPH|nr:hypothetical protein RNA01_37560 [Ciceribacter naphthalenivorans]GLR23404.1 hypothetical protein GCM10007920_31950 [Ciceribacter naphthalenivorans]GLT06260.1 hypothetical protein GCM10007926_31950 [Sphingomonas psychrolutea]